MVVSLVVGVQAVVARAVGGDGAVGWMAGVAATLVVRVRAAVAVLGAGVTGVTLMVVGCRWCQGEVRMNNNLDLLGSMGIAAPP